MSATCSSEAVFRHLLLNGTNVHRADLALAAWLDLSRADRRRANEYPSGILCQGLSILHQGVHRREQRFLLEDRVKGRYQ